MQKNFIAFIVCAILILVGWNTLISWLQPIGMLTIQVDQAVDLAGVKLKITDEQERTLAPIDLAVRKKAKLPPGKYKVALEGTETLQLATTEVVINKDKNVTVAMTEVKIDPKIATAGDPKAQQPKKKPDDDPDPKRADADKPNTATAKTDKPTEKRSPKELPADVDSPINTEGPPRRETLGSLETDDQGYRMLVTLTSAGAAVERIELNESKFLDLEDRRGYLGHLAIVDDPQGVRVTIVGPGTPAAIAGLVGPTWKIEAGEAVEKSPGDLITSVNGELLTELGKFETPSEKFHALLSATRPKATITLGVLRGGKRQTLSATLVRRPLEIVRPEIENTTLRKDLKPRGADDALSFLMTLDRFNREQLGEDDVELDGVELRSGHWQILDRKSNTEPVVFYRKLARLGIEVRKTYRLEPNGMFGEPAKQANYHLAMSIEIKNTTKEPVKLAYQLDGPTGMPTEGSWYAYAGLRDYIVRREAEEEILRVTCQEISNAALGDDDPSGVVRSDHGDLRFIGIDTQYFASVLFPKDRSLFNESRPIVVGKPYETRRNLTNVSTRVVTNKFELAPGSEIKHQFDIFAGPKLPEVIETYGLVETVDYGMFSWVAKTMQGVLHFFYGIFGNFGIAIIMLTILVRLCMFPLSRKQVLGAQKMQELQPEIKRINEKFKKNMEARNKATQALFKKHNYRPLGGCLLIFFQFPIFIGLYRSLQLDVQLRQAPLIEGMHWCSNLAAPDMLWNWSGVAPGFIQNGINGYMALGPYFNLLPLFTVALFILQQKLFTPPPTSEQAEMQQKVMKYMMLFIGLMFYKVASGLCLYFIASSLWGLGERKLLPKPKPKADAMETRETVTEKPKRKTSGNGAAGSAGKRKKKRRS